MFKHLFARPVDPPGRPGPFPAPEPNRLPAFALTTRLIER